MTNTPSHTQPSTTAPGALHVYRHDGSRVAARQVVNRNGLNIVVKPSRQGSALGVAFPKDIAELEKALDDAFLYDERALVEELIEGKEFTVGPLEQIDLEAFPVIEVRTPPGSWYDYEHRYTPGFSEHIIPADLPEGQYRRTQELAKYALS